MADLKRSTRRLARQLNVPLPQAVADFLTEDGLKAAREVRDALQEIVDEADSKSTTGALRGYQAKVTEGEQASLRFTGSSITAKGIFEYFVTVEASGAHENQGINIFNLLDAGRPRLKKRSPGSPYVLWSAPLERGNRFNPRITGSATRLEIKDRSQKGGLAQGRPEPRSSQDRGAPMAFSLGPLRAVAGKFLYQAGLRRAKARLGNNFTNWDVIFTGNPDG